MHIYFLLKMKKKIYQEGLNYLESFNISFGLNFVENKSFCTYCKHAAIKFTILKQLRS